MRLNTIEEQEWIKYYRSLWYEEGNYGNTQIEEVDIRGLDDLTIDELTEAVKAAKK